MICFDIAIEKLFVRNVQQSGYHVEALYPYINHNDGLAVYDI